MSKNSTHQRMDTLKQWDHWMENEHPSYKERKNRKKKRPEHTEEDDAIDFSQYGI